MTNYLKIAVLTKGGYTWCDAGKKERDLLKRSAKAKVKAADHKTFREVMDSVRG